MSWKSYTTFELFFSSVWGGPRVRKGTKINSKTYTDGSKFHNEDTDSRFPHHNSKTRESDKEYRDKHKITETCPSVKIVNNNDEDRVSVAHQSRNNVKLLMSCYCKFSI